MARTANTTQLRAHGRELHAASTHGLRDLFLMVALAAAVGLALWKLSGPPRLLSLPDWPYVRQVLAGSELADTDAITVAVTIAWLALGYLAFVVCLRTALVLLEHLSGGARWARTGMRLSSLITVPAIRRIVDGGVAATILLASWLPDPSRVAAAAAPAATVAMQTVPIGIEHARSEAAELGDRQAEAAAGFIGYTVVRGDSLWDIARRFYGDGSRYVQIFDANHGRVMADEERFTDPRLIRPGWTLRVPLPAMNLSAGGDAVTYRVAPGDDLWGIAARFLGDGFRWMEIWEHNRGREMGGGWRFTDPSVIYPGWVLELPIAAVPATGGADKPESPLSPEIRPAPAPSAGATEVAPAAGGQEEDDVAVAEDRTWSSVRGPVLFTAAGFALIGGAVLFVHRLRCSGLLALPRRRSAHASGAGDAGRVALAAEALSAGLADHGFGEARVLLVREAGSRLTFAIDCAPGDTEALAARRHELARRLACEVEVDIVGTTRVEVRLPGFGRLAASLALGTPPRPVLVVPVGADAEAVVYLNLAAPGSIAIVGSASERRQLLRSWLATLATTHGADRLSFRANSAAAALIDDLTEAPHFAGVAGGQDAGELALELETVVQTRSGGAPAQSAIVAVMDLTGAVDGPLASVLRDGPSVGVFVVAGVAEHQGTFGASAAFRDTSVETEELDQGEDNVADGTITLKVGRTEELILEPVLVRRDISSRWRESAEVSNFARAAMPSVAERAEHSGVRLAESSEFARDAIDPTHDDLDQAVDEVPSGAADRSDGYETTAPACDPVQTEETDEGGAPDPTGAPLYPLRSPAASVADSANPLSVPTAPNGGRGVATAVVLPDQHPPPPASLGAAIHHGVRQPSLFPGELAATEEQGRADAGTLFTVRCLGGFEVHVAGSRIERWQHQKAPEMLALLIAHGSATVPREAVSEALWPEFPWDESVQHMLSNVVSSLRATLRTASGQPELRAVATARRGGYQLKSHLFRVDLDAFEAALRAAATAPENEALDSYERAFALYRGDFLDGHTFSWAEDYRADYRRRLVDALRRAAEIAVRLGESERARQFYQQILDREPTDEAAARGLMRVLADAGDINATRKTYKVLAEAIQRELDDPRASPAAETRALLSELLREAQSA